MTGFSDEVHAILDGRSMGRCEVCVGGRVVEHHHRRPRGSGGSKDRETNLPSNGLALCGPCHRMIESHRTVALLLGWLLPQGVDPAARRVMYRGEWAVLSTDGGVTYLGGSDVE